MSGEPAVMNILSRPSVSDADFPAWWRGYWAAQAGSVWRGHGAEERKRRSDRVVAQRGPFAKWEHVSPIQGPWLESGLLSQ